jgi:hypothetical protein
VRGWKEQLVLVISKSAWPEPMRLRGPKSLAQWEIGPPCNDHHGFSERLNDNANLKDRELRNFHEFLLVTAWDSLEPPLIK